MQFNVKDSYPSITRNPRYCKDFSKEPFRHKQCWIKNYQAWQNNEAWKKKSTDSCFDVTTRSYGGAETCELVAIYTLNKLENITAKDDIGLYHDPGLILLRELNEQQTDEIRKNTIKVFNTIGFQIEIETNIHENYFLDVTFNFRSETYCPYKKSNGKLNFNRPT